MENDQRLTPLPKSADLHVGHHEYSSYSSFYDDETIESKRSVKQYFAIIYKRLPIILALSILVTAGAAFFMYRQPSIYEAQTTMIIEARKPKIQSKDSININFGEDINYYNTQLKLLQNPDLMKEVVIRLGLYRDPNAMGNQDRGLLSGFRSIFSGGAKAPEKENSLPVISDAEAQTGEESKLTPEENTRAEIYASQLAGNLKVEQQERTNIVYISVQNPNPELAAKVSRKVAEVFIDDNANREMKGSSDALAELKKSIEDLKATINDDEEKLIGEMKDSGLPLADNGQDLAKTRLQGLSETWMKSLENRRQIEARYNAAVQASSRGEGATIPDIYENKVFQDTMRINAERKGKLQDQIRDIETKIQASETEKSELLVKYTPEYSKVKEMQQRIDSLTAAKTKTEAEVSRIIESDQKKIEKDALSGA